MGGEEGLAMTMEKLSSITPGVTSQLQDFCELALENIKVYRPEISRLDAKTDATNRELADINQTMRRALELREEEHKLVQQRCSFLEERMVKLEALVAVLPTWKEDLVSKIDALGREGRVRHEQMSMRTQMLEDQHTQNVQTTRERLDTLSQLARTMAEARAQHSERMDGLEKQIKTVDATSTQAIKELRDTTAAHDRDIQSNQRKLVEHGALLSMNRIDIDALRQKAIDAEREIDKNTSNILELQDKQDLFHNNIVLMDKQLKSNEVQRDALAERVNTLERDTRVAALQATAQDYVAFKSQVADFMHTKLQEDKSLEKRLADMDQRIDKGPPGLWKITEQVAAQAEELARHRDELTDTAVRLGALDDALANARKTISDQKHEALSIQSDGKALSDKMTNEVKRIMTYVDSRLDNLCARYEVEAMRKLIEQVKRELHDAISSMGHRVKFELLHDEVPQVNTLKAYIQQSENAMARTMDRLGWLEAGLGKENERVEQMANEWCTTKSALDAMILDGTFDVARMKRELQGFKDMFEELGRMAARGQIITVSQAEALVDKAIRGPAVDAVVGKKLMDSKILKSELQGYVPRHELEGLRNLITANSTLALMASNAGATAQAAAAPSPEPPRSPSPDLHRQKSTRLSDRLSVGSSSRHHTPHNPSTPQVHPQASAHSLAGTAAPPPAAKLTVEDSALLAVYQRLAVIDQALAVNNALSNSLQEKVDAAVHQAAAAALQVEAEVPSVKAQLLDLQDVVSKVRSGHTESAYAESAVRRMVNKTVLPEVIERQANDTRRLVQYMSRHMNRTSSDVHQVKGLAATVDVLKARLDTLSATIISTSAGRLPGAAQIALGPDAQGTDTSTTAGAGTGAGAGPGVLPKEGSAAGAAGGVLSEEGSRGVVGVAGRSAGAPPFIEGSKAAKDSRAASLAGEASGPGMNLMSLQSADSNVEAVGLEGGVEGGASQGVLSVGALPSKEASSTLEDLIVPSQEQQAMAVRALDVRLEAMENVVVELQVAIERLATAVSDGPPLDADSGAAKAVGDGGGKRSVAMAADEDVQATPRDKGGLPSDVAKQISDLQVQVLELMEQLPLMAKGYEMDGLKRAMSDLHMTIKAQGGSGNAPQLHISLACPATGPPHGQHPPAASAPSGVPVPVATPPSRQGSSIRSKAPSPEQSAASTPLAMVGPASVAVSRASSLKSHASSARVGEDNPNTTAPARSPAPQAEVSQGETNLAQSQSVDDNAGTEGTLLTETSQSGSMVGSIQKQQDAPQLQSRPSSRQSVSFGPGVSDDEGGESGLVREGDEQQRHFEQMAAMADCYTLLQQHCAWQQVVAGQLAEKVAALQVTAVTADERATAVEKRWLSSSANWQQGMSLLQEALPRMEHLASTTQRRVTHILNHTAQFVVKGQLDDLTGACESIVELRKQIGDLQATVANARFEGPSSPAVATPKIAKNKQAPKARSNLVVTDLEKMSLPLPQLLPSFTNQNQASSPRVSDEVGGEEEPAPETDTLTFRPERQSKTAVTDAVGAGGVNGDARVQGVQGADVGGRASPIPTDTASRDGSGVGHGSTGSNLGDGDMRQMSRMRSQGGHVGSMAPPPPHPGMPGWGADGTPRHLHTAEHADTELAGIMHDMMHASFRELLVTKDGPLPGAAAQELGQGATVREAALKRLRTKPYEVQQHVELLESARKQLERLVSTTAVSTTDYVALCCLMLDVRVKLMEDHVEVHKEQVSTAFRNLESAFAYLKKLQEAVNSKGSLAALSAVDRCLRSLGKEMVMMGHGPMGAGQPGLLHSQTIGSMEFWAPFLSMGGADMTTNRMASPPRSPAGRRQIGSAQARPLTPSTPNPAQVIPLVTGTTMTLSGSPFPPPSFLRDKRDVIMEQQRVMATLKAAEAAISHGSLPTVQYVSSNTGGGGTGLPVLARKRPSTARPDVRAS